MTRAALFILAGLALTVCLVLAATIPQAVGSVGANAAQIAQAGAVGELGRALQLQALGNLAGLCIAGVLGLGGLVLGFVGLARRSNNDSYPAAIYGPGPRSGQALPGGRAVALPEPAQRGELVTLENDDSELGAVLAGWLK